VLLLLVARSGSHHVDSSGGRQIGLGLHVELLQLEVVSDGVEREQRLNVLDEGFHVVVLLALPTKKLEDEVAIRQPLAQGVELIHHALHLAVIVADAKSALPKSMKSFLKLKDARLTVAEELCLDSKPRLSGCLRGFVDDLLQLSREGAKHPRPTAQQRGCQASTSPNIHVSMIPS
jgi:hypothetical protein